MQAGTINALYVGLIFHFLKELSEYPTHTTMMVYKGTGEKSVWSDYLSQAES